MEENEHRKICVGCQTGNYYACLSFPGVAPAHAQREIEYRKRKARRVENSGRDGRISVYRREDIEVV